LRHSHKAGKYGTRPTGEDPHASGKATGGLTGHLEWLSMPMFR